MRDRLAEIDKGEAAKKAAEAVETVTAEDVETMAANLSRIQEHTRKFLPNQARKALEETQQVCRPTPWITWSAPRSTTLGLVRGCPLQERHARHASELFQAAAAGDTQRCQVAIGETVI